jgi:hypothetical protein
MNTLNLKPAPGKQVRDPVLHDLLPPEGRKVAASEYWTRRLRDGDVVPVLPPAKKTQAAGDAK